MSKRERKHYSISPSSLAFLYEECPACWRRGVVGHPLARPFSPFPSIFGRIDKGIKQHFVGRPGGEIAPALADGTVVPIKEQTLQSAPVGEYRGLPIVIRGKLDSLIEGAGGDFAIVDYKTSNPREDLIGRYARQLHCYQYILENPGPTHTHRVVERLGLFCFEPYETASFTVARGDFANFGGTMTYHSIEPDRDTFTYETLPEIVATLTGDPKPGAKCGYCEREQTMIEYLKQGLDNFS